MSLERDDRTPPIEMPEYLTPAEVGRACNMSRRSAKTLLRGAGLLELKDNGRWHVRAEALRERLPDVWARVERARPWCEEVDDAV